MIQLIKFLKAIIKLLSLFLGTTYVLGLASHDESLYIGAVLGFVLLIHFYLTEDI